MRLSHHSLLRKKMERQAGQPVVLLTQRGGALGLLLRGLKSRGGRPHVVSHPAQVMGALGRLDTAVLLIDQPDRVQQLGGLLAAVRRYYPRVRCWRYDASGPEGRPALSRVNGDWACQCKNQEAGVDRGRVAGASEPSNGDGRTRGDRVVVDKRIVPGGTGMGGPVVSAESILPEPVLSQEEMMMLIGRGSGDEDELNDPDVNCSQ